MSPSVPVLILALLPLVACSGAQMTPDESRCVDRAQAEWRAAVAQCGVDGLTADECGLDELTDERARAEEACIPEDR